MADFRTRHPANVEGKFYVDDQCLDCDLCRETAPNNFRRDGPYGRSYVFQQPSTPEELALCFESVEGCPHEAIGHDGDRRDWAAHPAAQLGEPVGTRTAGGCSRYPMARTQPPLVLRLAAILSIAFGTVSIVDMVAMFFRGHLWLDFGFVGILIGRGLLMRRQSSRSWAITLSGIGLLFISAIASWGLYSGRLQFATREHLWLSGMSLLLLLLVCATIFFGLRSASVREWFRAESSERIDSFGWTAPLVLVSALFASASAIRDSIKETSLAGLFPVHTQFEFSDASTGGPIDFIGYSSEPPLFSTGQRAPLAPRISFGTATNSKGLLVKLGGLSGRPVDLTFTSKGYEPVKYKLDAKSPEKVTLSLRPSK